MPPIQSLPKNAESECLQFKTRQTQPLAFKGLLQNTSGRNGQSTAMPNTVSVLFSSSSAPPPPKPSGKHYNFYCTGGGQERYVTT